MNQFDRENQDVFRIVHNNPRRTGIIRDVGVIVPISQAQRYAAYEAASRRDNSTGWIITAIAVLGTVCATAVALL